MSSPEKKRNFKVRDLLIVVGLFFVVTIFYKLMARSRLQPQQDQVTQAGAPAPTQATTDVAVKPSPELLTSPPTPNLDAAESAAQIKRLGLCRYSGNERFISFRLVHHIQRSHPEFVVLPSIHSACITNQTEFGVVDYDPTTDVAFDYLGQFEISFDLVTKYTDLQSFSTANEKTLAGFGFENINGLNRFLGKTGPADSELRVFKLRSKGQFKIRNPIGRFAIYPGIKIVETLDAENLIKKDPRIKVIDLRVPSAGQSTWPNAIRVSPDVYLPGLMPSVAKNRLLALKNPALPDFKSSFLLIGLSEIDRNPLMFGSALTALGSENVMVLKKGARPASAMSLETPIQYNNIQTISFSELTSMANNATIVDTRGRSVKREGVKIKDSYKLPVDKRLFSSRGGNPVEDIPNEIMSGQLEQKYDILSRSKLAKKAHAITEKKIILIGVDDYDWTPLLVANSFNLHQEKFEIYWYRPGFRALEIFRKTGEPTYELEKRISPIRAFQKKVVKIPATGKKAAATVILAAPKRRTKGENKLTNQGQSRSQNKDSQQIQDASENQNRRRRRDR